MQLNITDALTAALALMFAHGEGHSQTATLLCNIKKHGVSPSTQSYHSAGIKFWYRFNADQKNLVLEGVDINNSYAGDPLKNLCKDLRCSVNVTDNAYYFTIHSNDNNVISQIIFDRLSGKIYEDEYLYTAGESKEYVGSGTCRLISGDPRPQRPRQMF